MEEQRLLLTERSYKREYHKYWGLVDPDVRKWSKAAKAEHAEWMKAAWVKLNEYTGSKSYDPVKARYARRVLRKSLKEKLKKGTWLEQLAAREVDASYQ